MSRPQKMHTPIKGTFNSILASVAAGTGKAKRMAKKAERQHKVHAKELGHKDKPSHG